MNTIDSDPRPLPEIRRQEDRRWLWFFIATLVALAAWFAGLTIGARIGESRPPAQQGFVDVRGHEGEILVVLPGGQIQWTTEAQLHAEAGHA